MGLGGVLSLGPASILLHFHSVKSVTPEGKVWGFLCVGGVVTLLLFLAPSLPFL